MLASKATCVGGRRRERDGKGKGMGKGGAMVLVLVLLGLGLGLLRFTPYHLSPVLFLCLLSYSTSSLGCADEIFSLLAIPGAASECLYYIFALPTCCFLTEENGWALSGQIGQVGLPLIPKVDNRYSHPQVHPE